ncbi:hypothetical protein PFISCL1PPCAC_5004, partial [Pristionchus fissidentatus]
MVYSEELGYDPDEWEECPPPDHFLVFSPLTRLVLSLSAIGFCALFFWLVDNNKSKGGRGGEESEEKVQGVATTESSLPSSDFISVLSGLLTGRATTDSDFVQKSFRDDERLPAAAAAVRDVAAKIDLRPDETEFHYKPAEEPKTAADVRAEIDRASFELRDLLGSVNETAPPVPPHRHGMNEIPEISQPLSQFADQIAHQTIDAAQRAREYLGGIQPPTAAEVSDQLQDGYDQAAQQARDSYDRAAAAATNAYERAGQPFAAAQQHAAQFADAAQDSAAAAYEGAAAVAANAYDRASDVAAKAYDHTQEHAAQLAAAAQDSAAAAAAYDRAAAAVRDPLERVAEPIHAAQQQAASAAQQLADGARDAYDRAQASPAAQQLAAAAASAAAAAEQAGRVANPLTTSQHRSFDEDFERVQRDLDNLMAEHTAPLGVIIPGASTSTSPAASHQLDQPGTSPIDEHVRLLTAGLLTSDSERMPSDVPSLHDIYEERQRQLSPPLGSPVKIPTMEDRAALRDWEEELARVEAEKVARLGDIIVGGDDISDIAASEEHLLPADHISMYSQESSTVHPQDMRIRGDNEAIPAAAKINQKIDQISSALEQSLLSEIEQLARQTSTMQAELARARDSEYSADELSEGGVQQQGDPRVDAFQPAADVRFIPADQAAPISHRNSERQSGESDDFVKITPPSHSGAPSPSPFPKGMSPSEEEQLRRLVDEYDVIGDGATSTLKKDASAPAALSEISETAAPAAAAAA